MDEAKRRLKLLAARLAVCRLEQGAPLPGWALSGDFCSVTRAPGELSVICAEDALPARATGDGGAVSPAAAGRADAPLRVQRGFRAFQVEGPLAFELTGWSRRFGR
jgi:hypothetical protein